MNADSKPAFAALITDALAFYRQDVSTFALSVWWQACQPFDMEQVAKALTAHALDPERGHFAPKPADLVRTLQGTRTDRSLIAWGKVLDAMQRVGAYSSVVFDDGAIHAAIEDVGGWVAVCRGSVDELPHLQRRFCASYQAYAARGDFPYPAKLIGAHDQTNAVKGYASQPPALIGNAAVARAVLASGSAGPKTQITFSHAALDAELKQIGVEKP